jgi:hypothetical protein
LIIGFIRITSAIQAGHASNIVGEIVEEAFTPDPLAPNGGTHVDMLTCEGRFAVPMVGGMVSSTLLTLLVISAIYAIIKGWGLPKETSAAITGRIGVPTPAASPAE